VAAGQDKDVQELYALYPVQGSSSRFQTLGKLEVVTYGTQAQKLVLVPVNGAGVDKDAVERYLNEVYHPAGVDWSVEQADNFQYADTTAFFAKGSGLLSAYTPAMRRLNDAYRQERGFAPGTAYLFVMDDSGRGRDRDAAGFMPRGKQAGYIFKGSLGGYDIAQVIAHELGHGRWRLRHTFDKAYGGVLAQESTDNLMDYKAGNNSLAKWQWDEIVSPAWFTNPFEGDGEGEITLSPGEYLGFSPQGDVIKGRPADYGGVFYTEGSYFVTHFKIKDKTLYSWDSSQKCYLSPKGDNFKDFATEPVTGKVALWNPNYKNDCFAVYKWVEVTKYTKATDFPAIQDKVQTDDGTGWTPDIKEDASEACKAEAEKVKGGIKPNCTELPANQDTLTLNWLKEKNFQGMDAECLAGVSTPKRKELIAEIASKQAITGSDETLLQKLTVSTPGVQAEEIYRSIRDGGLIGSVLEKTQLAAHNDILAQLILWQRKWENSHTPRKTIVFSESSMWPGALKGVDAAPEENGVKLQSGWISEMGWDVEERFSFTDNVWIYFHDAAGSYKAHQAYHLTALEAYSIFSKQARKETIQTARLMADVALMAVAVGEISACYDAYKASKGVYGLYLLIKSGTDASVGLADIVIQNALAEQWSKTPEGLARLDRWNKICTAYTVGSLSASAIDLAVSKYGKTIASEKNFDEICGELEGKAVNGAGSYLENLARYKQLFKEGKISELFSELKKTTAFPKMGNTRVRNHTDLLAEYKAKYGQTAANYPYSSTNPVTDFELAETGYFVRVYSGTSTNSSWIFRIEDLRQYGSVDEIIEKLALPSKPTKVGLVELPDGVKLRKSYAGPQNWSNGTKPQGGGIQYEIIGLTNDNWFKPLFDNINDFFK
jgi:hypothetical protein